MKHLKPYVAIEWPKGCTYWRLPKVKSILDRHGRHPSEETLVVCYRCEAVEGHIVQVQMSMQFNKGEVSL